VPLFAKRPDPAVEVDPHLAEDLPLIEAAHAGDTAGLAARLTDLRELQRWHHRHQLVARAARADRGTAWIETWASSAPGDVDALSVRAVAAVRIARQAADPRRALQDVTPMLESASDRLPEDPTVWSMLLEQAHGLDAGVARVHDLVARAAAASSTGFAWRSTAVELLSDRWYGSLEESWDFAVTSAEVAPQTRLVLLPAYAVLSQLRRESTTVAEEMLTEALGPAAAYLETCRYDEAEHVEAANSLAARLVAAGRRRETPSVLAQCEDRVDTVVWGTVVGPDPVGAFMNARRTYLR
jgi:hypothetical protein